MGKNGDLTLSRLWTKVHAILKLCRRFRVVSNPLACLCISCFVRKIWVVQFSAKSWSSRKGGFESPICTGRVCLRFRTYIFKSHSLLNMWPVLVQFRSANSDG